ncbi:DHH family phosphoesterase, partial [Clostridioides difficile]|nr:DHH family phosphoesterase [Clostridioides difficile]
MLKLNDGMAVLHAARNERKYQIRLKAVYMKDSPEAIISSVGVEAAGQMLVAVYLFDETEILSYKQMVDDQKMVAGLIYLDNYD